MVVSELFARLGLKVDEGAFNRAEAAIGGLKKGLAAIGVTLAAGAVIRGLQHLVDETASAAGAAGKAAQRVGVTRQTFEELGFAAEMSGLSVESLETGLKFLNRNLFDSTNGNHQLAQSFRELGVGTHDSSGKLRGADEVLGDLAERFAAMPDGPKKTAMAMHLLGRSGSELIPMLNKGREAIAEYRAEAHELGLVFSEEAYQSAKQYSKASRELGHTIEGIKRQIGSGLLVEVAKLKKAFAEWLQQNRELIRQRVTALALGLATALKFVAQMLEPLVRFVAMLASNAWLATGAVAALGVALNWAFLLPVAVIGTLLLLLEELWGWITGERATLLEEWLGKWEDIGNYDFTKTPLVNGIRNAIALVKRLDEAVTWLRRKLFFDETSPAIENAAPNMSNAVAYQKLTDAQKWWAEDQAKREADAKKLGWLDRYTYVNQRKWDLGATIFTNSAMHPSYSQFAATGTGSGPGVTLPPVQVTMGDINIGSGVTPGVWSPDELARTMGDEFEKRLQRAFSDAYAGVTR